MQKLKSAELCAGYNGLGRAIEQAFNAEPAWFSEFDPAPSKILAYRYPTVPNYGDMTLIDWADIEPVDVLGGGTPCQDLSHAGKRKGMTEGTRSNLWVNMREAVAIQQPKFVVWENVRGAYSAEADSDLEQCPGCLGDPADRGPVLRALGRVLGDLADLGYDCQWRGLRAADVGACHPRYRVFVLAVRRDAIADAGRIGRDQALKHDGRRAAVVDRAGVPDEPNRELVRLGPLRETTADGHDVGEYRAGERSKQNRGGQPADGHSEPAWGDYGPAVARWESVMGRRAPAPTEPTGRDGQHQLSSRFTEWMMGLPEGWLTDPAIGISRNDQLKACGNGVVEQQAVAALSDMLAAFALHPAANLQVAA